MMTKFTVIQAIASAVIALRPLLPVPILTAYWLTRSFPLLSSPLTTGFLLVIVPPPIFWILTFTLLQTQLPLKMNIPILPLIYQPTFQVRNSSSLNGKPIIRYIAAQHIPTPDALLLQLIWQA